MHKQALRTRAGRTAKNQIKVYKSDGVYFESYDTAIAKRGVDDTITLDPKYWNYSKTTLEYLKRFLDIEDVSASEIRKRIKNGMYKTANLN